jgi:N-methylhydantoinase B
LSSTSTDGVDLLTVEIVWHRLVNAATEQWQALLRTAFSTVVRESEDCAAGIFDATGNLLAQAPKGTPGQINSMATCIGNFLAAHPPEDLHAGDVLISNDPWKTAGHLNDITVVTPVFRGERLVGFMGTCAHSLDIGGRGFASDGQSTFEEGLFIPIMKLADRGRLDPTLLALIRHNVRSPDLVIGDILAQATCNEVGGSRMLAVLDEFGLEGFDDIGREILARSESVLRRAIAEIPDGDYAGEVISDGFSEPVMLRCVVRVRGDALTVDFAGSSPQVPWGINVPLCYTASYTTYALKCALAPNVPNNAGTFRAIDVAAPPGSVLNAIRPAPVAGRHIIGNFQPLAVYQALAAALPDKVIAGSSVLWITTVQGRDAEAKEFTSTFFASGGMGARPDKDGLSATSFPGNIAMTPIEMLESVTGVVVEHKALRPDSGGPGRCRGGLGQDMAFTVEAGEAFSVNTMNDQLLSPPFGLAGGGAGGPAGFTIGDERPERPKARRRVATGVPVLLRLPGGGGYGDPLDRRVEEVAHDVAEGLVTPAAAHEQYGVVGHAAGGTWVPDRAATERERIGRRNAAGV